MAETRLIDWRLEPSLDRPAVRSNDPVAVFVDHAKLSQITALKIHLNPFLCVHFKTAMRPIATSGDRRTVKRHKSFRI